jgi:hypothetical protein
MVRKYSVSCGKIYAVLVKIEKMGLLLMEKANFTQRTIRIKPFPGRALTQKIKTKIQ